MIYDQSSAIENYYSIRIIMKFDDKYILIQPYPCVIIERLRTQKSSIISCFQHHIVNIKRFFENRDSMYHIVCIPFGRPV